MIHKELLIFRKAIEKAIDNGYVSPQYPCLRINYPIDFQLSIENNSYMSIIFSHDFAKAFWGKDPHDFKEKVDGIDMCTKCHIVVDKILYAELCWEYHLQKMLIESEPLKYIEKFLDK